MRPKEAQVTVETALNGELIFSGFETGSYLWVSPEIIGDLLKRSADAGLYPYKVHGTRIEWHKDRAIYKVYIEVW